MVSVGEKGRVCSLDVVTGTWDQNVGVRYHRNYSTIPSVTFGAYVV